MRRHEHRQQKMRRTPNYSTAVLATGQQLEPGKVYTLDVEHDAGCSIWRGKPCNCTPLVSKPKEMSGGNRT